MPAAKRPRKIAPKAGLVLTAGGARGAYQAGVLKRIGEIKALKGRSSPFPIVTGASAGAINGAMIAAHSDAFCEGSQLLAKLWGKLEFSDVIRTDAPAMLGNLRKLVMDISLGGLFGAGRVAALLDASPLREFLRQRLPLERLPDLIANRHLYAVGITATSYHSGRAYTFVQGRKGHPTWLRSRRVALPVPLEVDHICASAAIPIVFAPVPLSINDSPIYFGDGAMRMVTPLSPAIRLGAERVFAIGIRSFESAEELLATELRHAADGESTAQIRRPPLAQICGVFLNAIFLDHLDADIEHLERMNRLVDELEHPVLRDLSEPLRRVEPMVLSPSEDLAVVAKTFVHRLPRSVRYLIDGLGTPDAQSADLTSYLLFDKAYTRELIDIGYRDASVGIAEIEHFLFPPSPASRRSARDKVLAEIRSAQRLP